MTLPLFHTGDVFLFEHDDSCISRLICKLSNSPISHAAMFFENNEIIEEGVPCIGTRPITKLGDRAVHVRRHKSSPQSRTPLLSVARKHLEAEEPYSMGNLVAVGVLLVFNSWKPDARWAVKQALKAVCILLAKAVDRKKNQGKRGSTCSQLVYDMYAEAGFPLNITQKNALADANSSSNLASLALEAADSGREAAIPERLQENVDSNQSLDLDKLCCVLLAVLGESETNELAANENEPLDQETYEEIVRFASLLWEADGGEEIETADKNDISDWAKRALEHLLNSYSGFVSPGQLYSDCPDLAEEIAVIHSQE